MKIKDHEKRCQEAFSQPYTEIHEFLDQYMDPNYPAYLHRRIFHHQRGVDLIVEKFGEDVREAAILHIQDDNLVNDDGQIIRDWDDYEWLFFRGQQDIDEQAVLLEEWYGESYLKTQEKLKD